MEIYMKQKSNFIERIIDKDFSTGMKKIKISRNVVGKSGFNLHSHDFFEIEIVLSGNAVHVLNGQNYNIKKGMIYLLGPSDCHKYIFVEQDLVLLNITFDMTFIDEKIMFDIINNYPQSINIADNKNFDFIQSLFLKEYEENFTHKVISLKNLLEYFIILLLRLQSDSRVLFNFDNNEQIAVRKILIYIHSYFKENITLGEISKYTHLTETYLCDVFKATMSKTIFKYIKELKLDYSAKLLGEYSYLSVGEICYECGYNTSSNFYRDFKKRYGISPLEYRNSRNFPLENNSSEDIH